MPRLRRGITETRRFDQHRRERIGGDGVGGVRGWLAPLAALARSYPRRVAGVTLAGTLYAAGETGVFQFCGYFTLNTHHWEPWRFSLMVVVAGGVGMLGNVLAGRLGDLFGRRPVGFAVAASFPGLAWLFYHVPGTWLPVLWAFLTVCSVSCNVTIRALTTLGIARKRAGDPDVVPPVKAKIREILPNGTQDRLWSGVRPAR